ncbi:MAG: glycoside hydrolase family 130 protein [Fidelibacterota bacterium]|nr:MAG: glycoside hydrolase family 130 protein [Candidatus Neomarinimicrobiota bacterium]
MSRKRSRDLVHRWEGNPIITIENLSFPCADISTAGAIKVGSEYILLITIQSLEGFYSIYKAQSIDGYHFTVMDKPVLAPSTKDPSTLYDQMGVLDARIVHLGGRYYVSYDALSSHGYRLALARTTDFQTFERLGLISEPDMKGGVLFPRKLKGKYARLDRPWEGGNIWISYSEDLVYWGWSEVILTPRGGYWDCNRVGVAAPPIRIEQGWLIIYYGVKDTSAGPLFRLGAAVLERGNPAKVLGRTDEPILSPREYYERVGDLPNLVFSCGAILESDGEIKLYYGASNSCIAVGSVKVDKIVKACMNEDNTS